MLYNMIYGEQTSINHRKYPTWIVEPQQLAQIFDESPIDHSPCGAERLAPTPMISDYEGEEPAGPGEFGAAAAPAAEVGLGRRAAGRELSVLIN